MSGPHPLGAPAVRVSGLLRRFGETTALDGVSFDVEAGSLFGVVGPDGAGKTTLLRILAGVLRPSGGDALVGGVSVAREPERVKPRIAYMSQRFGLYGDLTVAENLAFYADLYRVPADARASRLERLYHFSGLEPFRDRLAARLSGGMKQKLGLSCALIHEPETLLLDEPTFGVDPISRRDLWLIIHEMVSRGTTVIVSTAYLDEAERMDRLVFLDRGRVVAHDTPSALRASAEGTLVALEVERPRAVRAALAPWPEVRRVVAFGRRLHVTLAAGASREALLARLGEAGLAVTGSRTVVPSLEDVFIERMGEEER